MLLTIEKVIILKSIELFSEISEKDLLVVSMAFETIEYEENTIIINQGDIGNSMYIVISGEVDVEINNKVIATLGDKSIFGELAIFDPEPRSATIITTQKTLVFKIESEIMYDLIGRYANVAKAIIKILSQRIRKLNNKIENNK